MLAKRAALIDPYGDLSGFHECRRAHPGLQAEILRGLLGNLGRDDLIAAVESDLHGRHHRSQVHFRDLSGELISDR